MTNHSHRPMARAAARWPALAGLLILSAGLTGCADRAGPGSGLDAAREAGQDDTGLALDACGHGFWKNHTDVGTWGPTNLGPDDSLATVFLVGVPFQGATLLDALAFRGGPGDDGGEAILLRAAVTAVLNARHADIAFDWTGSEVVAAVDDELVNGSRASMLALAEALDLLNDGACVLDSDGDDPAVSLPDLIVSSIVLTGQTATTFSYRPTVQNVGTAPAELNGVNLQGWYSTDEVLGNDGAACGILLSTTSLLLQPGDSLTLDRNCGLLPGPDHLYLLVEVDGGDVLPESDETNNVTSILLE